MMSIRNLVRHHAHFFLIIVPLILVMTYPTINYVFDTSTIWAPTKHGDIWLKFWDAWHFKQILAGESGFFHTKLLYYPAGIALHYQTYNLPHIILLNALQLFLPPSNAYCLAYLLMIFACALTAYIYCMYLFRDSWLAILGAVIFGLSQQVTGRASHPDLTFVATLPLTLYFLHRGFDEGRTRLLALAGLALGFTAYIGIYMFVCAVMTAALFVPLFAKSRWREKRFWRGLAAFGILTLIVGAGKLAPLLSDPADLNRAIQSQVEAVENVEGRDLIGIVVNYRHPILTPLFSALSGIEIKPPALHRTVLIHGQALRAYAGITTLLLIGIGLLRKSSRRKMLPWLLIAAIFMILRLGPVLQVNGVVYRDFLLPKHFLDQLLPTLFAPFYKPAYYQIGVVLPLAVLACYGLRALLSSISSKRRVPLILFMVAIIAFETYYMPYATEIDHERFSYIDWLKAQEDQESIRLVPLPMKLYSGKYGTTPDYMLHQSKHGYSIVNGSSSRIAPANYRYMEANTLLSAALNDKSIACSGRRQYEITAALDQLDADGFSHVVLHKRQAGAAPFLAAFADITPAYDDWYASVYEIPQLRQHCQNPPPGTDSLSLYLELVYGDVIPPREEAVLSFHPSEGINDEALRYLSWNNDFGQNLNHLTLDSAGTFTLQSTNPQIETIDDFIDREAALLLLNHPADSEPYHAAFADWLASHYQLCGRIAETDHIAIDYHLRHELPCELVFAADKMRVRYDNGSQLRNRVFDVADDNLTLSLWWQIADGPKTSYSIQLFDAAGDKARQLDDVMNRMMRSHRLDLRGLPQGEYHARMIVYDFETGASHAGEIVADSTRFSRDIEIARFRLHA